MELSFPGRTGLQLGRSDTGDRPRPVHRAADSDHRGGGGFIYVLAANGRHPAAGVTVSLESGRTASTGVDGKYRLEDVPEGGHVVSMDMERLPADYNPAPNTKFPIVIGPRK